MLTAEVLNPLMKLELSMLVDLCIVVTRPGLGRRCRRLDVYVCRGKVSVVNLERKDM